MKFTEQELEDKLRKLIQDKVIPNCKQIQILASKDVTDIICCDNEIASRFVRNFIEKSRSNQAAFCSFSHSIFCSRSVSALM